LRVEERQVEAQRTRIVNVASPSVVGAVETLKRAVDVLDYLCTRGKLNEREQLAAGIYRSAWDMVQSSIGGQMDFERARGGTVPGGPLAVCYLEAAAKLREAEGVLDGDEIKIVRRVVALNYSLSDVAVQLDRHKQTISNRLKAALGKLADLWEQGKRWQGEVGRRPRNVHRGFNSREMRSTEGNVPRAKVAHADRRGVRYKASER
jgi:predicted DNA-binding protein (UPF0251 family)